MSAERYALAGLGRLTYGIEGTAYSQAGTADTEPGITNEDIDPPNPNEHTAMPHGGAGRSVFILSPDEKDYEFDVPVTVHNADIPLETVLGSRTESSETGYDEVLFEEADRLPTATWKHVQEDLDFVSYYVGSKASMDMEWAQGDPLQMTLSVVAAALAYDDQEAATSFASSLDTDVSPYRAHMAGEMTLSDPSDDSLIKSIATINSGTFSWDNGLESQHHGGDPGRESFAVAETTGAEGRYDMSVTANITDADLFGRAYDNDIPVDVEQAFVREEDGGTMIDAVIVRLLNTRITDAPISNPAEGVITNDIQLMPESTEIEVRTPT